MDHIHASVFSQKYPFATEVIDIKSYFESYEASIKSSFKLFETHEDKLNSRNFKEVKKNQNEFLKSQLDFTEAQVEELMNLTSSDNLNCEGELESFSIDESNFQTTQKGPVPENNLESLKEVAEKPKHEFPIKQDNYKKVPLMAAQNATIDLNPFNFNDIVFCVKVYHPIMTSKEYCSRAKLLQEIHLLGEQQLDGLREKIKCNMDHIGLNDASDDYLLQEVGSKITAKEKYPSSFIFIEDTFYKHPSNDPSNNCEMIKEWAEEHDLGSFKISAMLEKRMIDIPLKIGHPYVYQHQGSCEHIIVFSDVRFLNPCDSLKSRNYPGVSAIGNSYARHCMMCKQFAKWLVVNNKRLTHDKCYLCNKCYKSYNYKNGVKIGDFRAYEFVDPAAIL